MKTRRIVAMLLILVLVLPILSIASFAEADDTERIRGYLWNPQTGELKAYHTSPEEVAPPINLHDFNREPYVNPISTHGIARAFYSYSPSRYTYDYTNSRFRIGSVRVDNSGNKTSSASLQFTVKNSGSCSTTVTSGMTYGGEVQAIYAKASLEFSGSVAATVSWSSGTDVGTASSVPPGQIGKITAYVVGLYSQGTATYTLLNTSTDEIRYDSVGIGAIIPTTQAWNLVVEIPAA